MLAVATPSGVVGDLQAHIGGNDVATRERRLEQLVMLQKEVMLQQQRALQGLARQQAELSAQESRFEKQLQGVETRSDAFGAAALDTDPVGGAHLDLETFKNNLATGQAVKVKPLEALVGSLSYLILMLLVGCCYGSFCRYEYGDLRHRPSTSSDTWSFGLCAGITTNMCDPDWRICCCSCFCAPIRWADTVASTKVGFLSFWLAIILFTSLEILAGLNLVGAILLLTAAVMARQTIRQRYGLPHGTCDTVCQDCCVWCCCSPCAIMQEALQVQFVELSGEKGSMQSQVQRFPSLDAVPGMKGDPFLTGGAPDQGPFPVGGQARPPQAFAMR